MDNLASCPDPHVDDTIIDITDEVYDIEPSPEFDNLLRAPHGVPLWPHKYIFGAYEINYALPEQQAFYNLFKSAFLEGRCYDIEDNSNYVFVLLFELMNEYRVHQDIYLLERQLKQLADNYPVARSYALSYLVKLIAEKESERDPLFIEAASYAIRAGKISTRVLEEMFSLTYSHAVELMFQLEDAGVVTPFSDSSERQALMTSIYQIRPAMKDETEARLIDEFPDFYWTLSQRYGKSLNLNRKQKHILDQTRINDSSFNTIEFFRLAILRLFLETVEKLDAFYALNNSSLALEMHSQAELIARKYHRYRQHSRNYNNFMQSSSTEQFSALFKICENGVRRHYGHKRRVQIPAYCSHPAIVDSFSQNMYDRFDALVNDQLPALPQLNDLLETELNAQNTTRWKEKFGTLVAHIHNGKTFMSDIHELVRLNRLNPSKDQIYFEASKAIAKTDKTAALTLYIYYLNVELKSELFDYKSLSKSLKKNLFHNDDQLAEFEAIVSSFIEKRDLQEALKKTELFYLPQRRHIHINRNHVRQIQQHHADTVSLLNKYLQDEEVPEVEITVPEPVEPSSHLTTYTVPLNEIQEHVLHLFEKNNYRLLPNDLSDFVREKGYFLNQVIDSINDVVYDLIDDLLIEEEEDCYIINTDYYHQIKTQ